MIDLKALMGDTSDNIPGVPGIGEKTAMALVQEYGAIDEIYRLLPDLHAKPAAIRKLTEGEESARHSYWLATIVTDAPLDFDPAENLRQPFRPELYDLFLRLEFQKLIDKYHLRPHQETAEKPEVTATVVPVRTEDQARDLLAQWRQAESVTVYAVPDLSALSVQWDAGENASWAAELWTGDYQGDWQALLAALFAADIPKVSHNVKDLMRTLLDAGLPAEGFVFDTALAAYLLDATAGKYDLPRLFVSYFNQELPKPVHLEPDAFSPLGDRSAAWASLHSYGAAIEALHGVLLPRLREQGMEKLYFDVELPLCRVLADMERSGFLVDGGALARFGRELSDTIDRLEQRIYAAAGQQFNINSPKQLGINPQNDGKAIRLSFPQLTEERRKDLVKQIRKYTEGGKVAVRNIRRDAMENFKKQQKASEITEDELKMAEKDLQKLTDDSCKELDKLLENKEKELLSV